MRGVHVVSILPQPVSTVVGVAVPLLMAERGTGDSAERRLSRLTVSPTAITTAHAVRGLITGHRWVTSVQPMVRVAGKRLLAGHAALHPGHEFL
jgi:hypothetical protein